MITKKKVDGKKKHADEKVYGFPIEGEKNGWIPHADATKPLDSTKSAASQPLSAEGT